MKTIRLLAAVLLAASAMPALALTSTIDGITWTYTVSDGVASIASGIYLFPAVSGSTTGTLVIPPSLDGYPVTSIGRDAFYKCTGLTSVTIPGSVTSIGNYAFYGCTGLTSVTIPDSVTSIGGSAFSACTGLTSMTIPDSVTSIGSAAFGGCTGLISVMIPNSVTNIGDAAFGSCSGLTSVTIPDSVMYIGVEAFRNCTGLTNMTIGNSVQGIGKDAFRNCTGLTSVTIPDSVTSIGYGAFRECSGLTSISVPDSVTSYAENCFEGCPAYTQSLYRALFGRDSGGSGISSAREVALTVTNVVVHYVTTAAASGAVTPSEDVGIVNIISEVHAGAAVAISSEWATQYGQAFTAKFGSDFTKAVTALTGKRDGAGNAMQVWQDFVAGTDPTDENDVFTASITFDADGKPQIAYSPKFENEAEAAKRKYTTYGKVKITDKDWTEVPEGEEAAYNFFKVTVEMK